MTEWDDVGGWVKDNVGSGASLIGSMISGSIPSIIASGISFIASATGTDSPDLALKELKNNPEAMIKLKQIYLENESSIRKHIEEMTRLNLEDKQLSHGETQTTIREGDRSEDKFVRWTRPGQSWCSLFFAFWYVTGNNSVDITVLSLLLGLPFGYTGLRQIGKGIDSMNHNGVKIENSLLEKIKGRFK